MGVYDDKTVTVKLALSVRDYLAGATAADAANRHLQASQRALGNESGKTGESLTRMAEKAKESGKGAGTALKFLGIGIGALGASGGALKVLPPLLAATGTGLAALPGMAGGAINSAIVLKAGLSGIGEQLGAIYKTKDPYSRLGANARNFLAEAGRIKPMLQQVQSGFQERIMQGTGADLQLLATKTLPQVRAQLNELAADWSHTFAEISLGLSDQDVVDSWNVVLGGADRFFDQVNSRIRPTIHALAGLATEGQPVADAVGKSLIGMLDKFNGKVEQARKSGSLAAFFEAGAEAARDMARITSNVLDMTGMVISEVSKQNTAVGTAGDKLNAYVVSGRAAEDITGIVHTLTTAWEGLATTVGPIAGVLRDALADPGTAASIQQMFAVLSTGSQALATVLQIVLSLNNALGGTPLTLLAFGAALMKLRGLLAMATAATTKGAAALAEYGAASSKVAGQSTAMGTAATKAAGRLPGIANGAGKAVTALFALDAAHSLISSWKDDDVDIDKLGEGVMSLAQGGAQGAEMTRLFGKGLDDLGVQLQFVKGAQGDGFGSWIASAEHAIPIAGDLATALGGAGTFEGSKENFAALDKSLTDYVSKTGDAKGAQTALNSIMQKSGMSWGDLRQALPQTSQALSDASIATEQLESGTAGLAERQALLNAPLEQTITLGRTLTQVYDDLNGKAVSFAQATIEAQASVDDLNTAFSGSTTTGKGKNKKSVNRGLDLNADKTDFDTDDARGRAQAKAFLAAAAGAQKAAQAKIDDNGTVKEGAEVYDQYINRIRSSLAAHGADKKTIDALIGTYAQMPKSLQDAGAAAVALNGDLDNIPKGHKFTFDGTSMIDAKGNTLELAGDISKLPVGKSFTWNGKSLVDGKGKAYELKDAIAGIPSGKKINVTSQSVDGAKSKVNTLSAAIRGMPDGNAHVSVDTGGALATLRQLRANITALGGTYVGVANRRGGIYTRAAAEGLLQPMIAPPGTRYQWAEPETGGEAFIPKKGDQSRGRAILGQAAEWYGMRTVPMRAGGITIPAANGLVNVAPSGSSTTSGKATRLDYAEAYVRTRDAVTSLNKSLKDNGRSFSVSTTKGRENRSALFQVIRAAQDAADTKFKETGSVKQANAAYDAYIARLRKSLQQQKVNAGTVRSLMSLATRPTYDTGSGPAPTNSLNNIAYAKAAIGVAGGLQDLRDKLSLNQTTISMGSDGGRDNLTNIIGFFETAASSAQAKYEQTHNAKAATSLYNGYIGQLRSLLKGAGYSLATINLLVRQFGRITLTSNARGGVYMAQGGLGRAGIFPPGDSPLYGFAEPGTGGEAFLPRNGNQSRGEDILRVGAGWYGGRYVPAGGGGGGGATTINNNLNVTPLTYNPSTTELLSYQRQMDAQARTGRRR